MITDSQWAFPTPNIIQKSCFFPLLTTCFMHLLQVPLASCIPFQNWDPPLYGQLKKPLSPRYFFLSRSKQILLSPLSSLNIHLDKIHSFVSFVSVNPSPPASFGVIRTSHLAIWYFLFQTWAMPEKKFALAVFLEIHVDMTNQFFSKGQDHC